MGSKAGSRLGTRSRLSSVRMSRSRLFLGWVGLHQSPPPLHRMRLECGIVVVPVELFAANGNVSLNCLSQPRGQPHPKLIYTYDLGDSWEHAIVLEKQLPVDPIASYPVCTDGKLACSPDDCGGIPGFYNLVEAFADPDHEQHKELRDWLGHDFDPMAFSIDSVNQMLLSARRRGKAPRK